ncbi:MAG: SCO2322 family protein [Candidatus Nanopelagicales bacterium]
MNPVIHGNRRGTAILLPLVAILLAGVALAAPASATAYRYWSYWLGATGTWEVAQTGPGGYNVVDQDVQGWRFGITTESASQKPDNDPDFAALCPDLAESDAPEGQLRVAVVLDSGFTADAPNGQRPPTDVVSCVTVPAGSTGNQALAAAATVTEKQGLVCGINGYPADECGAPVSDQDAAAAAGAAATEKPNPAVISATNQQASASPASPAAMVLGLAALAGVVGAVLLISRRRRELAAGDPAAGSGGGQTVE